MSGEFQHAEDTEESENLNDFTDRSQAVEEFGNVVGEDGDDINYVHWALQEGAFVGRDGKASEVLDGEPDDAHELQVIQVVLRRHCSEIDMPVVGVVSDFQGMVVIFVHGD